MTATADMSRDYAVARDDEGNICEDAMEEDETEEESDVDDSTLVRKNWVCLAGAAAGKRGKRKAAGGRCIALASRLSHSKSQPLTMMTSAKLNHSRTLASSRKRWMRCAPDAPKPSKHAAPR